MLYCDQAAAMQPDPEILDCYHKMCRDCSVNIEAGHQAAFELRKKLEEAGEELSVNLTGSAGYTPVWCNTGTGAFLLLEHAGFLQGKQAVTTHLEHPALESMLRRSGGKVDFLRNDSCGRVIPEKKEADFAAVHAVQSELGTRQDLKSIFEALPERCCRFCDGIQGAGKFELDCGADLIAVSGVKFGSPAGAALLVRKTFPGAKKLLERFHAARHPEYTAERFSPAAALTLAFAAKFRAQRRAESLRKMALLNHKLRVALEGNGICFTVPEADASAYILHATLPGKQGMVIVRMLSEMSIMAGSGSACASESQEGSPALAAIGLKKQACFSGLRLSFGMDFSSWQADFLIEKVKEALKNY